MVSLLCDLKKVYKNATRNVGKKAKGHYIDIGGVYIFKPYDRFNPVSLEAGSPDLSETQYLGVKCY